MVPAVFVELDRMPLLPSGKIDRLALPSPSFDHLGKCRTIAHARTDVERTLSSIWREVLKLDPVGIDDDFFDLGGHSLSGMRVLARVRRDFLVDVPIRTLFDKPTIAELAVEIEKLKAARAATGFAAIAPTAPGSPALLDILRAQLNTLCPDEVKSSSRATRIDGRWSVFRERYGVCAACADRPDRDRSRILQNQLIFCRWTRVRRSYCNYDQDRNPRG